MDLSVIYNTFEDDIDVIEDTTAADNAVSSLLASLKEKDPELFFDLDSAIGALARAYQKQGFCGGIAAYNAITL